MLIGFSTFARIPFAQLDRRGRKVWTRRPVIDAEWGEESQADDAWADEASSEDIWTVRPTKLDLET
jgi:hypothetical protein